MITKLKTNFIINYLNCFVPLNCDSTAIYKAYYIMAISLLTLITSPTLFFKHYIKG